MARPSVSYAALLRGINLGKNRRVAMADLRAACTNLGYGNVQTIVQSGNVTFTTDTPAADLQTALEAQLTKKLGIPIELVLLSAKQLQSVIDDNPFPQHVDTGAQLSVTLFKQPLPAGVRRAIDEADVAPDEVIATKAGFYMWCPNGMGRSRAGGYSWTSIIGTNTGTNRNWNTIKKLGDIICE